MKNLSVETRKRICAINKLVLPYSVLSDQDLHAFLKRQKEQSETTAKKEQK